jgi:cell division septum initiation protein DivIVA
MKPSSTLKLTGLLAAFSLASTLFAAAPPTRGGSPTAADIAANRSQKASGMLAKVHQDAQSVVNSADTLNEYDREAFMIDWRADARTLESMRGRINKIDQMVHQLRAMEAKLPQAQQSEINQIAPAAAELTDNAQIAIDYLRNNQDRTMFPPYTSYADEMYTEAARIVHSTT